PWWPEAVLGAFFDFLAVDRRRVFVFHARNVDQGGVPAFAAVDRQVGVARVGEDDVVAGGGEVGVVAAPAQQLVFASVADQGVVAVGPLDVLQPFEMGQLGGARAVRLPRFADQAGA